MICHVESLIDKNNFVDDNSTERDVQLFVTSQGDKGDSKDSFGMTQVPHNT